MLYTRGTPKIKWFWKAKNKKNGQTYTGKWKQKEGIDQVDFKPQSIKYNRGHI